MPEIRTFKKHEWENFNCPVLKGIARISLTYLCTDVGTKSVVAMDCQNKHQCGIARKVSPTVIEYDWQKCPKHESLNK